MTAIELAALGLATFRLSRLLAVDDGPFEIFARLRALFIAETNGIAVADNMVGKLLMCPYWCLTMWVGALALMTWCWFPIARWFWIWLAIAQAGAIVGLAENRLAR